MANELISAFNEIAEMRSLPQEVIIEALQTALVSAYRRDANASAAQRVEAHIDPKTGRARIFVEKEVAPSVISPETEVTLEKARYYDPEAQLGDTVMVQVEYTTKKFGRIAAQNAKQVILQKIREAEREALLQEYASQVGDLVTAQVQSTGANGVTLQLNARAEASLPRNQMIPGERYRQHEKIRVLILEVKRSNRGPQIICSRSHKNVLRRLLEYEVPEIYNGQVEVKSIAREAGHRSKVAVAALQEGIDPVGACVGMRGIRIQNIVKELHDEKIDVIEWNPDPVVFISKALSPARVAGVYLEDDPHTGRTAVVIVQDDQLSLAIGKEGQNARLAAKLTGWRIDIKSVPETVMGALENLDLPPLSDLLPKHAALVEEARSVMQKKLNGKTVMPEEFTVLARFADIVERRLLAQREEIRKAERAQIEAVKVTLPPELFSVPISYLNLPHDIAEELLSMNNVGEIMLATLVDEYRLRRLLSSPDSLNVVQEALDTLMASDIDFSELVAGADIEEDAEVVASVAEAIVAPVEHTPVAEPPAEPALVAVMAEPVVEAEAEEEDEDILVDAFGGHIIVEQPAPVIVGRDVEEAIEDDEEVFDEMDTPADGTKKDKKSKKKRRQLVFDEQTGEVVSKRRRKSNRKRGEWDDFEF